MRIHEMYCMMEHQETEQAIKLKESIPRVMRDVLKSSVHRAKSTAGRNRCSIEEVS